MHRRHGIVEYETTMHHLHRFLKPGHFVFDIGAGTGRYTSALMSEGYEVKAVELVKHNIDVFLQREPTADVIQGDARDMPFLPSDMADVTLLLGPLYHLIGDDEKLKALNEAKRVTKPGGLIFVAYLMNEYSILSYCFDEDRIENLLAEGVVDQNYHLQVQEGELYDYVRLDDINRFNEKAGLERETIFSPDGAADYMRTRLNKMSETTFSRFIEYQKCISERPELLGAGSHLVDVVRK
ncbi:MAG: class I SAM-dependent methyltransferase [Prevotellaceae bacterium]|nr:class I SAM-dependent methyltransferase [Prevotellaceae bacterium]